MKATIKLTFDSMEDYNAYLRQFCCGGSPDYTQALLLISERLDEMSGSMQEAIDKLRDNVARLTSVEDSVQAFVEGVPALIQKAVDDAMAKGATAEQMAALNELNSTLASKIDELAGDVVQNTPAPPDDGGGAAEPAPADTVAGGGDTVAGGDPGAEAPPAGGDSLPGGVPSDTVPGGAVSDTVSGGEPTSAEVQGASFTAGSAARTTRGGV